MAKKTTITDTHIAIIGAGPIGRITALKLKQIGADIVLIGPSPNKDLRTTALMQGSLALLDQIGLKDSITAQSGKLSTMRIIDATSRLFRARPVAFHASEIGERFFGANIPNLALNDILAKAIEAEKITHVSEVAVDFEHQTDHVRVTLESGDIINAKLVVGADGRLSKVREAANISVKPKALPQTAFVTTFKHSLSHNDTSTEFHTEHGPLTQVPLPERDNKHRSSLVWVTTAANAERLTDLENDVLSIEIEKKLNSILGKIDVDGPAQSFPLHMSLPSAAAQNRYALVGEAAHAMPPIGAQGMNLSLRDVDELAKAVTKAPEDAGRTDILNSYSRNRRLDILSRINAVGALNASLLSDMVPAQLARVGGMSLMENSSFLRGFFMREGMRPGSGFRNILSSVTRK